MSNAKATEIKNEIAAIDAKLVNFIPAEVKANLYELRDLLSAQLRSIELLGF